MLNQGKFQVIDNFVGEYRFLSNFYPDNEDTLEHHYQAAKAKDMHDHYLILRECKTPGEAKRCGRRIPLRPDWEEIKIPTMRNLLRVKFEPGTELAIKLLATEDSMLIEGNTWGDTFWGCVKLGKSWSGENWLGFLLMGVRAELRSKQPVIVDEQEK